jgi:large subunit ribosomal protein L24
MKIKQGDKVIIIAGKDKGATGEVLKTFAKESKLIVKGVNVKTKFKKKSLQGPGSMFKTETKIDVSNVALVDPKSKKATRVGYTIKKDGTKVRVAKKSNEVIE